MSSKKIWWQRCIKILYDFNVVIHNVLNKEFHTLCKRDSTSHVSHLSRPKCKLILLHSWQVAKSSFLHTEHASKSDETRRYCWHDSKNETHYFYQKCTVIKIAQVVCQLFMLWWLIETGCENGEAKPLLYWNFFKFSIMRGYPTWTLFQLVETFL